MSLFHKILWVILLALLLLILTVPALLFAAEKKEKAEPYRSMADAEVLDYIASNNPLVKTLEAGNAKKGWVQWATDNLKLNLKGKYSQTPQGSSLTVGGSGGLGGVGSTYDSGGSAIGIDFSFPLYPFTDPREKKDGIDKIATAREEVVAKASPFLKELRQSQAKYNSVKSLFDAHKKNLEYKKRRVDAGIDYQKDYFGDYLAYLKQGNDLDTLTSQISTNTDALLALVDVKARDNLKALLSGKGVDEDAEKAPTSPDKKAEPENKGGEDAIDDDKETQQQEPKSQKLQEPKK